MLYNFLSLFEGSDPVKNSGSSSGQKWPDPTLYCSENPKWGRKAKSVPDFKCEHLLSFKKRKNILSYYLLTYVWQEKYGVIWNWVKGPFKSVKQKSTYLPEAWLFINIVISTYCNLYFLFYRIYSKYCMCTVHTVR